LSQECIQAEQESADRILRSNTITYQTLFGEDEVCFHYLYNHGKRMGKRPSTKQRMKHLDQSMGLQQALSSIGSEDSFGQAAKHFKEHYGWSVHP
jgi:hypothetical protein